MKKTKKTYSIEIKSNFSGHHHSFVVSQGQANQIMHLCGAEIEKSRYETPKGSLSAFLWKGIEWYFFAEIFFDALRFGIA